MSKSLIPVSKIEKHIYLMRGQKVMFDFHLAELYGVETRALKQQVRRNIDRFPEDFMFILTKDEWKELITNCDNLLGDQKFTPVTPMAFTEQGVAMLSSVIKSKRAIDVNIGIMRTFVKLREIISTHKELAQKLAELERKIEQHDEDIHSIFEAIRQLMTPPEETTPKKIGFTIDSHAKTKQIKSHRKAT